MRATAYIVAATPRTGSSLLCEGLSATGVAGFPDEVFAPHLREIWREHFGLDESVGISQYVDAALRYGTSGNGVTAFKIHAMHVPGLAWELGSAPGEVLPLLLPDARFINIVRRDRRAQALSWFRANETDEWFRLGDAPAPPPPALDLDAVRELEASIDHQQAEWREYFAERRITPLTIEYESLVGHYRGEVARALDFLGLPPLGAAAIPQPRLARQADSVTTDWRRRLDLAGDGGR
jgi:LPS sulfotransferase NodH